MNSQEKTESRPISINWDDLNTRKVEQRLREQQAMTRNRAYARMDAEQVPAKPAKSRKLLNSTYVVLGMMGLIGGLLAWGCGFLDDIQPPELQAVQMEQSIAKIDYDRTIGTISEADAAASVDLIRAEGQANPYFVGLDDPNLSNKQRADRATDLQRRSQAKHRIMHSVGLGLAGLFLALCLGIAEPISDGNLPRLVRNAGIGAVLGLIGGLGVSLFVDQIFRRISGNTPADPQQYTPKDVLAWACAWGVLGLFLTAGPGVLMGSFKKIVIGMVGGLIGGAIGGALYNPLSAMAGPDLSRLVAFVTIGVVAGLSVSLIENVSKAGWLKVTSGLIAGKQFILYRNPTFIGSAPECQIYLFKDVNVGRRHAALHLVPGGIELEDLPLGQQTLVNNKPVSRARLRHGDRISIGATTFLFQEKVRS
jgi:hypothetical protein